ncbi:hypothetical protein RFI_01073 [Reticulomyxa filosa]|uniref:Uncharacterized protein n=1 Tax=Reticulomyxa filosa TaxID=46433 RepID=X6PCR0_RETFI|nr:hypothetical protein RFI_01073 [Reticulomyxa filosa]|eukprot:ETO35991.1 hypothetical protein RFI_01073 [Reticulomyxa filosa]
MRGPLNFRFRKSLVMCKIIAWKGVIVWIIEIVLFSKMGLALDYFENKDLSNIFNNSCYDCKVTKDCISGWNCINRQCVFRDCKSDSDCGVKEYCFKYSCCLSNNRNVNNSWSVSNINTLCITKLTSCSAIYNYYENDTHVDIPESKEKKVCANDGKYYKNVTSVICKGLCVAEKKSVCGSNEKKEWTTEIYDKYFTGKYKYITYVVCAIILLFILCVCGVSGFYCAARHSSSAKHTYSGAHESPSNQYNWNPE